MASSNPAFNNSPAFSSNPRIAEKLQRTGSAVSTESTTAAQLTEMYNASSVKPAETDRMSYEDTMVKIVVSFVLLLVGAAVGWFIPSLALPASVVGFGLAMVNIFKKKPSPAFILSYAAVEGVFVGAITMFFESKSPGIAVQAVLGTLVVVGVTLALFSFGKVRASKRATKVFFIAMIGYGIFSLINFILVATGINRDAFGLSSATVFGIPLGFIIGPIAIIMAAYSLVLDFDNVKTGVQRGAPRIYGWAAAFGLMVTIIWLYLEILRLIGLARR